MEQNPDERVSENFEGMNKYNYLVIIFFIIQVMVGVPMGQIAMENHLENMVNESVILQRKRKHNVSQQPHVSHLHYASRCLWCRHGGKSCSC